MSKQELYPLELEEGWGEQRRCQTYLWLQDGHETGDISTLIWTPTPEAPEKEFSNREMLRGKQGHGPTETPRDAIWELSLKECVAAPHL